MKKIFCLALTTCLVLAACGGSSDEAESVENSDGLSSGEQVIADALTAELLSDPEFPFVNDATCISETSISEIGLDKLVELEFSETSVDIPAAELPQELQEAFANAVLDCAGTSGLAAYIVEASAEDDDGAPLRMEDAECIASGLDREQWYLFVTSSFETESSDEAFGAEFFSAILEACPQVLVNTIMDDLGLDQEQAECLGESLSDTLLDLFATGPGGLEDSDVPPELFEDLFTAFIGCGVDLSQLE
ncbi:MAG: hypothetical protein CL431_04770 [Acidimicrobiaceae bacterium]|nr:hypothetical protein [Acidimicrobiaceae bacterium]|tara:strand:- start:82681 stop:83424 length:744 start_codon:yes stop_codon:yes gene_type:complete